MRREYINYMPKIPINISFVSVNYYPIHWHDSIEIMFVLKGAIDVAIETQTYHVKENEIEIINCDEAHTLKNGAKDNKILIFYIDPDFFERYYDDVRNVFFYTNSSEQGAHEMEKYYILKKYLSKLLYEFVEQQEGYEDSIQNILVELLYHLINNFHQLIYEEESLKEDEVQFERYDRIVKYVYNNYMNKISLQDIAKKEYLSSNYLSSKIKDAMGYNFNDFLNLTRVEESIKLLLDTDKTISEISDEMGFSHVRYFNKHFKRYYKCTPMQFRKKYKADGGKYEGLKKVKELDIKEAADAVSPYLEDYDRYKFKDKIIKVDFDMSSECGKLEKKFLEVIDIGNAKELLNEENKNILRCISDNIEFNYGIIHGLFTEDMNVFQSKNNGFISWTRVRQVLQFLFEINLKPIILLDKSFESFKEPLNILREFMLYFNETFEKSDFIKLRFKLDDGLSQCLKDGIAEITDEFFDESPLVDYNFDLNICENKIYDTCYMIPYIIQNSINNPENNLCFKAFDGLNDTMKNDNDVHVGDSGLISLDKIKKPSYYAYNFLSLLGSEIIAKGEGYIITKNGEDIQILLYSYKEDIDRLTTFEEIQKERGIKNTAERKYSINIFNLLGDYRIIKYELNEKNGSFYNHWLSMGKPERLTDEERELIKKASVPKISFGFAKKSTVLNIISKIEGYGGTLIILKNVRKHLN
ncbi:MAG TPA: AraC family transcriptional regulator [Clostridiaceae bacterium]|nr:AraC family transcriptional regulator [Clostridiaceae bacterium]